MLLIALVLPAMSRAQTYTSTTPGAWTYTVPANTYYVTVIVAGGGGGGGGHDGNGNGANGGAGKSVTAYVKVNPGDTLAGVVASGGTGGVSQVGVKACTGGGPGGTGAATGGTGGQQSCNGGYSGGGGGGGGVTSLLVNGVTVLLAGGGGGGGGGGLNNSSTANAQAATTLSSAASCSAVAGNNGANAPGDGGGGGGGGAGSTAGAGGSYGADNSGVPSTGGGGGGSCYVASVVTLSTQGAGGTGGAGATTSANGVNGGNGSVSVTPTVATLSLVKTKVSGDSTAVTVTLAATNLAATPAAVTSGTADNSPGTATAAVRITNVNNSVTVTESAFSIANYALSSANCVDASTNTSFAAAVSGNTITIAPANMNPASALTCTLLNIRTSAGVILRKQSIGGVGPFSFSLTNLKSGSTPVTSVTLDTSTANPATSPAYSSTGNGNVVFTETAVSGYATSYVCADSNAASDGNPTPRIPASGSGTGTTVTIPTAALVSNSAWVCTFTNTRPRTLTVTKALSPTTDTGTFVMTANGTSGAAAGNGATASSNTAAVGSTVAFSEAGGGGTSLANYTSSIDCFQTANASFKVTFTPATSDNQGGSLVMPDADVTCTITNVRKVAQLRLAKTWSGTSTGATATIPATTGFTNNTAQFNAAGGTNAVSASVTVYAGESGTLGAETMSGVALSNFTVTLSCDNGVTPSSSNGKTSNTVAIPATLAANTTITCTYANARNAATLTLSKVVDNTTGGTATTANFTLQAAGPATIAGVSGAASVTNASVPAGTYTLSETSVANYNASAWSCTNGVTVTSAQITLGSGASTTCTITNKFTNIADLSVTKNNGTTSMAVGQATDYTIVVKNNGPANANGAIFTDTPASGLTGCSISACSTSPATGVTCPATGSAIASPGGTSFTLTSFPAGSTITLTVHCTAQ